MTNNNNIIFIAFDKFSLHLFFSVIILIIKKKHVSLIPLSGLAVQNNGITYLSSFFGIKRNILKFIKYKNFSNWQDSLKKTIIWYQKNII